MRGNNIKKTEDVEKMLTIIESDFMRRYINENKGSDYTLIYKYLTHSDIIAPGKRNERQGLEKNHLNYLSLEAMLEMERKGQKFETAHQTCIAVSDTFCEKLGMPVGRGEQRYVEKYANVYLVNDTLEYFSIDYSKKVFEKLGKLPNWNFDDYKLNLDTENKVTKINLTYAAHGVGTARDVEFHKLRRNLFRNDRIMFLIENKKNGENNVFILLSKNPVFYTILGIKNDKWLRIAEEDIKRKEYELTQQKNIKAEEIVDRRQQAAWRKRLAEEMMNYTTNEYEVFCPLTYITVNYENAGTLFRASHIKRYADCSNQEKFDLNNGILMCANADALFDKHLITISNEGELIFSELIKNDRKLINNLLLNQPIFKDILNNERLHYLEEHRKVFAEKEQKRLSGTIEYYEDDDDGDGDIFTLAEESAKYTYD